MPHLPNNDVPGLEKSAPPLILSPASKRIDWSAEAEVLNGSAFLCFDPPPPPPCRGCELRRPLSSWQLSYDDAVLFASQASRMYHQHS